MCGHEQLLKLGVSTAGVGDAGVADTTFLCEALGSAPHLVRINRSKPLAHLRIQVPKILAVSEPESTVPEGFS